MRRILLTLVVCCTAALAQQAGRFDTWLQEVKYLVSEEDAATFSRLSSDSAKEEFVNWFWMRPGRDKAEHYRRLDYAKRTFGSWDAEKSKAYIFFGPPDEVKMHSGETEEWRYKPRREGPGVNVMFVKDGAGTNVSLFSGRTDDLEGYLKFANKKVKP